MGFGGPFQQHAILFYESAWYAMEANVRSDITIQEFLLPLLAHTLAYTQIF